MESNSSSDGIGQIYSGASDFGRFWAVFGAIVATIIGIIMIIFGIYILVKKSNLEQVTGAVISVDPPSCGIGVGNPPQYSCNITVSYTVNNVKFQKIVWYSGSRIYSIGQPITVFYNPNDPGNPSLNGNIPHFVGVISIILGVLVPLGAWFTVWLTRRYKFASAAIGVGAGIDIVKGIV